MKKLINKWHELYKHNLLSVGSKQDMGKRDNAMVEPDFDKVRIKCIEEEENYNHEGVLVM